MCFPCLVPYSSWQKVMKFGQMPIDEFPSHDKPSLPEGLTRDTIGWYALVSLGFVDVIVPKDYCSHVFLLVWCCQYILRNCIRFESDLVFNYWI